MLTLPAKIFLCKDPVSMHKSFEGLGTIIEQLFPGELLSGSLFVFLNRQRNCMKAIGSTSTRALWTFSTVLKLGKAICGCSSEG